MKPNIPADRSKIPLRGSFGSSLPVGIFCFQDLPMKKEVPGYGGKYWAGKNGHIYRRSGKGLVRVAEYNRGDGYPFIHANFLGKKKSVRVHIMILTAFHGKRPSPLHVSRHLDGSRDNNKPDNLAWGTQKDNLSDARIHGKIPRGERRHNAILTKEDVLSLREGAPYTNAELKSLAVKFGVHFEHIRAVANGRFWKHLKGDYCMCPKLRKGKTISSARRRADNAFSYYVRQRDADEGGTVACCTCGKLMFWRDAHCGHFVHRGRHSTRYDERNANAQGPECNTYRGGKEWEHGKYIDQKYGPGTAAELKRKGEEIQKTSIAHFDEITRKYRDLCEKNGWQVG